MYRTLVKRITAETARTGITTAEFVELSLIAEDRLDHIVQGTATEVTLKEMIGISLALDVSLTDLLTSE